MIVYDIEIKKAIHGKNEDRLPGVEYCNGWGDHKGMGVSCICAYDYKSGRYFVFADDNIIEFEDLALGADRIVGFNNISFDNSVIRESGICQHIDMDIKSYDLLREIWVGAGLSREFRYPSHIGYGLDDVAKSNFGIGKTGNGAHAPVDYQKGNYGSLINYCLSDVWITKMVLDLVIDKGEIIDPKMGGKIKIRRPGE